jgi:hypothetical protein
VPLQDEIEATCVVAPIGREGANCLQISDEPLSVSDLVIGPDAPVRSRVDCVAGRRVPWLAGAPLFQKRRVEPLRKAAERHGGAPQRSVFLGQPGKFLATVRTLICHIQGPLRRLGAFGFDGFHTRDNAGGTRSVLSVARQGNRAATRSAGDVLLFEGLTLQE